jgi:hypothetical protein
MFRQTMQLSFQRWIYTGPALHKASENDQKIIYIGPKRNGVQWK